MHTYFTNIFTEYAHWLVETLTEDMKLLPSHPHWAGTLIAFIYAPHIQKHLTPLVSVPTTNHCPPHNNSALKRTELEQFQHLYNKFT